MNIETASANVRSMSEALKSAAVPGKQTEGYIESEILYEGASVSAKLLTKKNVNAPKICIQNQVLILNWIKIRIQ